MKKDETLIDTAVFNLDNTEMSQSKAVDIMKHLIKHNYTVTHFSNFKDSLMDYPQWTIRATRPMVIHPESPRVKMDDLIEVFDKAINAFKETGKINIEIDQGLGALDISVQSIEK